MLKKFLSAFLCVALMFTSVAQAQTPSVTLPEIVPAASEPDVGTAISPMKKGDKAPFSGVLLAPKSVASIVASAHAAEKQIKIEVDKAVGDANAQCQRTVADKTIDADADKKIMLARVDEKQKQLQILSEQLKVEQSKQTSPLFWISAGTVGGVAMTLLTVWVVSQVK